MKSPRLKKQLALPLGAAALFALALYLLYTFAPAKDTTAEQRGMLTPYEWALLLTQVALWISLSFAFVRLLGTFIFFIFRTRKGYDAPSLMRNIFSLVAYVAVAALILRQFFGVSLGTLFSTSALLGVILGLALQDTLGNLFAGISVHADKPFQVGDVISVGNFVGVVEGITWRAVKIRNFQNRVIMVSNSSIAKESIEVAPRENLNARIVFFNALYTDSPVKVIQTIREAVRETENVSKKMTPIVRIRNLADSGVDYEIKYWLDNYARYNDTDALVRQRIWYAFHRAGLNFAYPTRTLLIERKAAGAASKDGRGVTERLSTVEIFSPLSAEELTQLACGAEDQVFAPGETIIRTGDKGNSMFVVHRGSVDVRITDNGKMRTVKTLHEGDFFGEMALFTGEPRTANVVAAEETEVLEIGHEAMKQLFDTNPALVESLSHTIAERRAHLAAQSETKATTEEVSAGILQSIKRFFRLK